MSERSGSSQSIASLASMDSNGGSLNMANISIPATELARRPTFAPPKPRPPRIVTQMNQQQSHEPEPAYQRQMPPPRTVSAMPPPQRPASVEILHRPPPAVAAAAAAVTTQPAEPVGAVKGQRLEWKQTLDLYRANAKKTDNPKIQVSSTFSFDFLPDN
jgi:hypothetical protein